MSGMYSREAFVAIHGEELVAAVERDAALADPPSPEALATVGRIFAPTVRRLAQKQQNRRPQTAARAA